MSALVRTEGGLPLQGMVVGKALLCCGVDAKTFKQSAKVGGGGHRRLAAELTRILAGKLLPQSICIRVGIAIDNKPETDR